MTSRNFPRVIEPAHGIAGSQTWCVPSPCPVAPGFSVHMLLVLGASLALCEALGFPVMLKRQYALSGRSEVSVAVIQSRVKLMNTLRSNSKVFGEIDRRRRSIRSFVCLLREVLKKLVGGRLSEMLVH